MIPFIFLSHKDRLEDRVNGYSTGADAYLTKPFEMQELLAKINALLEKSRCINSEITRLRKKLTASTQSALVFSPPSSTSSQNLSRTNRQFKQPSCLPLTAAEEKIFWEVRADS